MKKCKTDIEAIKFSYFLRDIGSEKYWYTGRHVFTVNYDVYINDDKISLTIPSFTNAKLNFCFEI